MEDIQYTSYILNGAHKSRMNSKETLSGAHWLPYNHSCYNIYEFYPVKLPHTSMYVGMKWKQRKFSEQNFVGWDSAPDFKVTIILHVTYEQKAF